MLFRRDRHHKLHRWFGDGGVQDLRRLNGKFRAFLIWPCMSSRHCEGPRDFATFREAALELREMHHRFFAQIVWC